MTLFPYTTLFRSVPICFIMGRLFVCRWLLLTCLLHFWHFGSIVHFPISDLALRFKMNLFLAESSFYRSCPGTRRNPLRRLFGVRSHFQLINMSFSATMVIITARNAFRSAFRKCSSGKFFRMQAVKSVLCINNRRGIFLY